MTARYHAPVVTDRNTGDHSIGMRSALLVLLAACGARSELDVPLSQDAGASAQDTAAPCTPLTLATGLSGVTQMLLDGDYLFFNGDELGRVLKTGGPVQALNILGGASNIAVGAVDVYFTFGQGGAYSKRKLANDEYRPVWLGPYGGGIAVDATAAYMTAALPEGYDVWKLPVVGNAPATAIVSKLVGGGPGQLALGNDGFLYGIVSGDGGGVIRIDTSASVVTTLASIDNPAAMALDATGIYVAAYASIHSGVMRIDLAAASAPFYYAHTNTVLPPAVAIDATTIYWTDPPHAAINSSPKNQAIITPVVTGPAPFGLTATALAVDDQCLYYAAVDEKQQQQEILRIPKP